MDENLMKEYLEKKAADEKTAEEENEAEDALLDEDDENDENGAEQIEERRGKKRVKIGIFWIPLAAIVLNVFVNSRFPTVGESLWFIILIRILIGVPFVAYALWGFDRKTAYLRAYIFFAGLSWFTPFVFSDNACIVIDLVILWYGAVCIAASFMRGYKKCKVRDAMLVVLPLHFLFLLTDMSAYTFVSEGMKFWLPALIGCVALTALGALLVYTGKVHLQNGTGAEKGACVFLVAMVSFAFIWVSAQHLNYALDTSEPIRCESEIIEKTANTSGKSDNYYFIVEENGEKIKLSVFKNEYDSYEKGDTVIFYYYEGAFGEPFYIE